MSKQGPSRVETVVEHTPVPVRLQPSKYDMFKYYNTLAGLLKSLVNQYTTIDLRNESYVSGKIISADGNMNVEMTDVVFCDPRGNEYILENFFVLCRNIRYVHIPKKFNSLELIEKQLSSMSTKKPRKNQHTFKKVRAERKQKETLMSIYDQRQKDREDMQ